MKKIIILIMICMLGLTACGKSENDGKPASSETSANDKKTSSESSNDKTVPADKTAPADSTSSSETTDAPDSSDKVLVIYFSATGTTKGVAEKIANVTNADLYEIIPAEPYSDDDLDWNDKKSRTTIEMNDPDVRPAIASDTVNLDGYTTIYIGYPIWWGDAPRIMSTFVEAHDFSGKTVIPFCTSGSSPIGRSGKNLASQAKSGNWLDGDRIDAGISESDIRDWVNSKN